MVLVDAPITGAQDLCVFASYSDLILSGPEPYFILVLAFLLDAVVGDPNWIYRRVPHPVAVIGEVIGRLEQALNDPSVGEGKACLRHSHGCSVVASARSPAG